MHFCGELRHFVYVGNIFRDIFFLNMQMEKNPHRYQFSIRDLPLNTRLLPVPALFLHKLAVVQRDHGLRGRRSGETVSSSTLPPHVPARGVRLARHHPPWSSCRPRWSPRRARWAWTWPRWFWRCSGTSWRWCPGPRCSPRGWVWCGFPPAELQILHLCRNEGGGEKKVNC